jgi:hypothetical protein
MTALREDSETTTETAGAPHEGNERPGCWQEMGPLRVAEAGVGLAFAGTPVFQAAEAGDGKAEGAALNHSGLLIPPRTSRSGARSNEPRQRDAQTMSASARRRELSAESTCSSRY